MKMRDQQWLQKEKLQLNVEQLEKKQLQREKQLQRKNDRPSKILTNVN